MLMRVEGDDANRVVELPEHQIGDDSFKVRPRCRFRDRWCQDCQSGRPQDSPSDPRRWARLTGSSLFQAYANSHKRNTGEFKHESRESFRPEFAWAAIEALDLALDKPCPLMVADLRATAMCPPVRSKAWAGARARPDSQCNAHAANRRNSARSPLYLASLRFLSNPCFRTFPLLSHTCHSHFVWLCLMIGSSNMAAAAGPSFNAAPVPARAHCIGRFGLQVLSN
jgi:hypothetical protein